MKKKRIDRCQSKKKREKSAMKDLLDVKATCAACDARTNVLSQSTLHTESLENKEFLLNPFLPKKTSPTSGEDQSKSNLKIFTNCLDFTPPDDGLVEFFEFSSFL